MSKKHTATVEAPKSVNPATLTPEAVPDLGAIRAAASFEDAVKLLQPVATVAKKDLTYEVVTPCPGPLPQKRGVSTLVYVAAVRQSGPFKVADLQTALPDKNPKNIAYWTRRLTTLGFLTAQA